MGTTKHKPSRRKVIQGLLLAIITTGISAFIPGCGVGYVVRSAYFQAELLNSREPIDELRAQETFDAKELKALDRIKDVKAFGAEIGLKSTENYDTFAADWDKKIWNLSACKELTFEPKRWTFPVVGRIPYLGFFRREDADPWIQRLEAKGYETYIRTAGAYSTLGWFEDPVLPGMLKWNDYRLADTVLHELAHATVWIKGSVKFNESFASFVGEVGAFQYLEERFGKDSKLLKVAQQNHEDVQKWRALLRELYADLDAVFKDEALGDDAKRDAKAALFASLAERVDDAGFHKPERFQKAITRGTWNNARLVQYKTYNHNRDYFEALFEREGRDLLAFMRAVERHTKGQKDPFKAIRLAAQK
jgi:predicted aminopeptidase